MLQRGPHTHRPMIERWIQAAALVVAVALVVILARQNAMLRETANRVLWEGTQPHLGMYVPAFEATTLDGGIVEVGSPSQGESQVLYFFLTTCEFCRASAPRVRELARRIAANPQPHAPAFLSVSIDSVPPPRSMLLEQGVPGPVVHLGSRRLVSLYRAGQVPRLLLIDQEGRVAFSRTGVIDNDAVIDSVLTAAREAAHGY